VQFLFAFQQFFIQKYSLIFSRVPLLVISLSNILFTTMLHITHACNLYCILSYPKVCISRMSSAHRHYIIDSVQCMHDCKNCIDSPNKWLIDCIRWCVLYFKNKINRGYQFVIMESTKAEARQTDLNVFLVCLLSYRIASQAAFFFPKLLIRFA